MPISNRAVSYCLNLVKAAHIDIDLCQFCNVRRTYSDGLINDYQVSRKFNS